MSGLFLPNFYCGIGDYLDRLMPKKFFINLVLYGYQPVQKTSQFPIIFQEKSIFALEAFLDSKSLNIIHPSGPIFFYSPITEWFVRNFNMWNHYFYLQDAEIRDFWLRRYNSDLEANRMNKWNSDLYNSRIIDNYNYSSLIKSSLISPNFDFKSGSFVYQPFILKDVYSLTNDRIFRFSRKYHNMNLLNFTLKNYDLISSFYYPQNHGKLSLSNNYKSIQHYHGYKVLFLNNVNLTSYEYNSITLSDLLKFCNFFNDLNIIITNLLQNQYKNSSLFFKIESSQIKHLLALSYNEIQTILWLMRNNKSYYEKSFLEVHWELYNNSRNFDEYFFFNSQSFKSWSIFGLSIDIEGFLFRVFENTRTYYNPFEMQYTNPIIMRAALNTHIFFQEKDLAGLPIHLLLTSPRVVEVQPENFFTFNINSKSRINTLQEVLTLDNWYSEKLITYLRQYGKFNRSTFNMLEGMGRRRINYQRNYYVLINPWWESLPFHLQEKFALIFEHDLKLVNDFIIELNKSYYSESIQSPHDFSISIEKFENFLCRTGIEKR
jgi:hypothetical protein